MASHKEIVRITGGRPWGFSVKGGKESKKPIVISKLEKDGKAELGGLLVGDVVFSVNDIPLSGYRDEAVHLIRISGHTLTLEVQRNAMHREVEVPRPISSKDNRHLNEDYYGSSPMSDQGQFYDYYMQNNNMQSYQQKQFYENVFLTTEYHSSQESSPDEKYPPQDFAPYQADEKYPPRDVAPYQADEKYPLRDVVPYQGEQDMRYPSYNDGGYVDNYRSRSPGLKADICNKTEYPSQPIVKLRTRKARDKGTLSERPRSWHASKSLAFDSNYQENMRPPESGYVGSYGARSHHQVAMQPAVRRSKGWYESGDLKSVYKPEVSESKDSLYSGSSQRSHKSARLSVSSSRSSGAMSSSRGSLENLVDGGHSQKTDVETYPQVILSSSTKYKQNSTPQPQAGIVSQQRNMFERLCQDSPTAGINPKSDDVFAVGKTLRASSDSSDKKDRQDYRQRDNSSPPTQHPGSNIRSSSGSSSSVPDKENIFRKRSYDKSVEHDEAVSQSSCKNVTNYKKDSSGAASSVLKHVNARPFKQEHTTYSFVPPPPLRDGSSAKAVKNHHRVKSYSALSTAACQNANPTAISSNSDSKDWTSGKVLEKTGFTTSGMTHAKDVFDKEAHSLNRRERCFGVVSSGKNGNVVATSVTRTSKPKDFDTISLKSEISAARPEQSEKSSKNFEVTTRSHTPIELRRLPTDSEHSKSGSADSKVKGKYGSVWKTPQTHRRARSSDFTNVLKDWNERVSNPEQAKLSIFASKTSPEPEKETHLKSTSPEIESPNKPADMVPTDLPSILRSLQNTQHGERLYKNFEPKSSPDDYDKVWYSESSKRSKGGDRQESNDQAWANNNTTHSAYNNWKSQFKEVDLDEVVDDACSPQDRYVYDIKDMSRKVLRVTSFARKDLGGAQTLQSVTEKRKRFAYQADEQLTDQPPTISHSRSRSHGSEIDDDNETLSNRSTANDNSQSIKPRPKSAGVIRSGNRHAPVMRATVVPPSGRPTSYYSRKSESLPRNSHPSYGWEDMSSPALSAKSVSPTSKYPVWDASVQPVESPHGDHVEKINKKDTRNAVIDFISRKTGRSFDNEQSRHPAAPGRLHSSQSEGSFKKKEKSPKNEEYSKLKSTCDLRISSTESENKKNQIISNATKPRTSPEKLSAKIEEEDKCQASHEQSSSSILDEEEHFHLRTNEQASSITSGERSASFDNLTDSGLDMSRASPSEVYDADHTPLSRSDQSTVIDAITGKHELIRPQPRRHPKQHRQRYSNSSNASSATTISTLSSFSSSSSTSMGRFPALGEEGEQASVKDFNRRQIPYKPSPLSEPNPKPLNTPSSDTISPPRIPIDSGTYRVPKRKKLPASKSKDPVKHTEIHRSTKTIIMSSHIESTHEDVALILEDKENKDVLKEDKTEVFKSKDAAMLEVQENVYKILEKVKRSASIRNPNLTKTLPLPLPPPPPPPISCPLDDATEKLLNALAQQRTPINIASLQNDSEGSLLAKEKPGNQNKVNTQVHSSHLNGDSGPHIPKRQSAVSTPSLDSHKVLPYLINSDSEIPPTDSENQRSSPKDLFKPIRSSASSSPCHTHDETNENSLDECQHKELPLISPLPLLPDVTLLPITNAASIQDQHPELTREIIEGDKALAQVFTTNSKKTLDYMEGILSQPSHDIIEEGMRYRRRKPLALDFDNLENNNNNILLNDTHRESLPASSTYYKTSASKGKILNLMKEKLADGEAQYEEQGTYDEMNRKKLELVLSIKGKLDDLENMKGLLDVEMRENECLGKQVCNLTKSVCSQREQEKYNIFVQDVDKIINLLLSLSGRLARVENAIQMLPVDAEKQEKDLLCGKRRKLSEQHKEAKQLKENIDRRQKNVSEILARHFDREQFADYEHYIKMKSALIMEQRELDDKTKLGREQMQCLRDSLPDEWQSNLDKLIGE